MYRLIAFYTMKRGNLRIYPPLTGSADNCQGERGANPVSGLDPDSGEKEKIQ